MSSTHKPTGPEQDAASRPSAPSGLARRYTVLIALVLFGSATTGYFLGLTSPMTASSGKPAPTSVAASSGKQIREASSVVPATAYSDMPKILEQSQRKRRLQLATLRQEPYDPFAKIEISKNEKRRSLEHRKTRRAYNGAPPTIPHPIDQLHAAACMACLGEGLRSKSLRASKMPHPYYSNCTQCHVEQEAKFQLASASFENTFDEVNAPSGGGRAYANAPPVIPHTTWRRNDCLACHGRTAALGMETTHPWRANCLQCHGESSQLNQVKLSTNPQFLPPPEVQQ
jgi:cytochrome c-type protein NapB